MQLSISRSFSSGKILVEFRLVMGYIREAPFSLLDMRAAAVSPPHLVQPAEGRNAHRLALRLEPYQPRYFRRLFAIESSVFIEDRYSLELFRHLCRDNRDLMVVARLGNRTVGYVMGELHPRGVEIVSLAVTPAHRNRGIGRRLMQRLLRRLKNSGVARVFLMVREGNGGAIALYRSLGFRRVRRIQEYYGDGEAAIRMRLEFD